MKLLLLVSMTLGAILFTSCATSKMDSSKCCKAGCAKCMKSDAKCTMHGKVGCTACKNM